MNGFKVNDVSLWRASAGVNKSAIHAMTICKWDVRNQDLGENAVDGDDKD